MLVGFTFPSFIYMKLGAAPYAASTSRSSGNFMPDGGTLNESVDTTGSGAPLIPGTGGQRRSDVVWILSAMLVCLTCPTLF